MINHQSRSNLIFRVRGSHAGFSLIEVMVASAILGIVVMGVTSYFGQVSKSKRKNRLRQSQAMIAANIRNSVKSPAHILYTITRHDINPTLSYCILGIGSNSDTLKSSCLKAMDHKNPIPFGLYQVSSADGSHGEQISTGEKGKPILYTLDGDICKSASDKLCIFEAVTNFRVTCADSDPTCLSGIKQAYFQYQVVQIKSLRSVGADLPPYPKVAVGIPLTSMQILGPHRNNKCGGSTEDLQGDASSSGSFSDNFSKGHFGNLVGYDDSGHPICKCLYPFVQEGESRDSVTGMVTPECRLLTTEELSCASKSGDKYLRGFTGDDYVKSAICVDASDAFDCVQLLPGDTCPASGWLTTLTASNCIFSCEYVPNKEHTCGVSWDTEFFMSSPIFNEGDDEVFTDFTCDYEEHYCCESSVYH